MSSLGITKTCLYLFTVALYLYKRISRSYFVIKIKKSNVLQKVNYGCGNVMQKGYLNIDIRYTKAVDLIGDLNWCRKSLRGCCKEVYLSHVLEHYHYPGKSLDKNCGTVIHSLMCIHDMLVPGGKVRIAVPDFSMLVSLYYEKKMALFPRISGRICGEQDYPENLHKCIFDKDFLELCLTKAGFTNICEWQPEDLGLLKDSSFDALGGVRTSLNLIADKPMVP